MNCPKCSRDVEQSTDQNVAIGSSVTSGLVIAKAGIFGMIAAPYLLPVVIGGLIWSATRKVACPSCGHRFTYFQGGTK